MKLGKARALSCASLLMVVPARPFPEERLLLDRRLEALRRILPDQPHPPADIALVREMAESSRLAALEVSARPPLETGSRGVVAVEVSAQGRYEDLDRFFRQVALSPRLIDVESLTLAATADRRVRLAATLHFRYRPLRAPLPPPPDGTRAQAAVPRPQADLFVRDQALAAAKSEDIALLRRQRRNPRLFLSELSSVVRDRPVVLSRATLGEEMLVSGLVVGESAMRALQSRLERGFFRISEVLVARQGACLRFEVRGRAPVVGADAEIPLPSAEPFGLAESSCRVDRDAGRPLVVRPAHSRTPPRGPIHLRVRDMDLADVFQVLHAVTGQGFVVDGDVQGRISLDLNGVELEPALAVLEKAGLRIGPPGPVRRVSRTGKPSSPRAPAKAAAPDTTAPAAMASLLLKRTAVRDVLELLDEAAAVEARPDAPPGEGAADGEGASGNGGPEPDAAGDVATPSPPPAPPLAVRPTWAPPGDLGRLSIWARAVPVEVVRGAVLDAATLAETVEGERRVVRPPAATATPAPLGGAEAKPRLLLSPDGLASIELALSGVVLTPEGWTALVYSPAGTLFRYRRGDRLADAMVTAVESTDILLETDEGAVRVALPDLTR